MPTVFLAAGGANIGTLTILFTDEDKESLAIFSQILNVHFADSSTSVKITTKKCDPNGWAPTDYPIVHLARCSIMELVRSGKVKLEAEGALSGLPTQALPGLHPQLISHLNKKGFRVNHPSRGNQDQIAYELIRQQHQFASPSGRISNSVKATTLGVALPGAFTPMCAAAKEAVKIFKAVIIALGHHDSHQVQVLVHTTHADTRKWASSSIKSVTIAQGFVLDQIEHNRVALVPRPYGVLFSDEGVFRGGDKNRDGYENDSKFIPSTTQTGGLPDTFVDLVVDCLFEPELEMQNYFLDIAHVSMELAGNQPIPPPSPGQPGGPASSAAAAHPAVRGQLSSPGLRGTQGRVAGGDDPSQNMAMSPGMSHDNIKMPTQTSGEFSRIVIPPNDQTQASTYQQVQGPADAQDGDPANHASSHTLSTRTISSEDSNEVLEADDDLLGTTY